MVALVGVLPLLFRGTFRVSAERVAEVMSLNEREAIRDRLLANGASSCWSVFAAFILAPAIHLEPSIVALIGAGVW